MAAITMPVTEPNLLQLDVEVFKHNFPNRGFKLRHNLCEHTEFSLEQLAQLAQRLPETNVECFTGNVPVNQNPANRPKNGLSIVDTIRHIQKNGSWMVLKSVQFDPEYLNFLRAFLDEVSLECEPSIGGMHAEEISIFIASPNSVTPYHLDGEHKFLLQIHGSEEVSMWDPTDRTVLPEQQAEYMLQFWHGTDQDRNLSFKNEFQRRARVFPLGPGEGLHIPVGAPRWVKNGPQVSVSIGVTFRSAQSEKQAILYFVNRKLKSLGLKPAPPFQSEWRDSVKCGIFQTGRRLARIFGGSWLQKQQRKWA